MRKFGICLVLTGAAVWSTGCGTQFRGQSSSSHGGIAVVDLDKVASETGRTIEMKEAIDNHKNSLEQNLGRIRNEATAILQAKLKEIQDQGEKATKESQQEFLQMRQNANTNFAKLQNDASANLSNFQQVQVARFRNELKPLLSETAAKRGISVVIPKNEGLLLTVDPGVDITDEIIKAYRTKRPAPTAPAPAAQASAPVVQKPAAQPRTAAKESRETEGESRK